MCYIFDLMGSEALRLHQLLQVHDVHTILKDFFDHGTSLVNLDYSLFVEGTLLPAIESIACGLRNEVSKEQLLLIVGDLIGEYLATQVSVVLEQLPAPDFPQAFTHVAGRKFLPVVGNVRLRYREIVDHLER